MLDHRTFPSEGTMREQVEALLAFAVRAPSTHNSQPWLFRVTGNICELYADRSRKLPEGDKDSRCLYISLGGCLENLESAAKYFDMFESTGIGGLTDLTAPVARLNLHSSRGTIADLLPTVKAMAGRFNARGPSLAKPLPDELSSRLIALIEGDARLHLFTDKDDRAQCAELTARGMRIAHADKAFRAELSHWMVSNYSARKDGIPGYAMLAPGPLSLVLPRLIRTFNMGPLLAKLNTQSILSAPAVGVITTSFDTPRAWLDTGRLFERASLLTNAQGAKTSVFVAAIESPELRKELGAMVGSDLLPQFLFTLGFPLYTLPLSPRHPPSERMV
ncbi:MAG: hypothetical protein A2948_03225 [Candidatus Lloydbacteria bacterium RIFCSPLOWO2_01_FULL_54_18]|nr:MAG: hypothetical protein A2948_03225 [Candidatus Lloydbacteria bacterium RIFCSPLOWO2_01_FULL_54_18]